MGLMQLYGSFLLKNPLKILICGAGTVLALLFLTMVLKPVPTFKDPLVGFEVRDTLITSRLNTWKLLLDETSASQNNLSLVPNSSKYDGSHLANYPPLQNNEMNSPDFSVSTNNEPPLIEMSTQHNGKQANNSHIDIIDEDEEEYYRTINSTLEILPNLVHYSLGSNKAFCGKLYEGYAQVVVSTSSRYSSSGLFNINSLLAICQLDRKLRLEHSLEDSFVFQRDCERFQLNNEEHDAQKSSSTSCCNSWSISNYVACLNNKTTCMDIDARDVKTTEHLINLCAPYYFKSPYEECFLSNGSKQKENSLTLAFSPLDVLSKESHPFDHWPRSYCGSIPEKCLRCDGWIYTMLNYLTNENFISNRLLNETHGARQKPNPIPSEKQRATKDTIINKLSHTNIFLPIAKGSTLMKYYNTISKYVLRTPHAQVKAMDLGLKNSLFEHLISDDTRLFIIALVTVLVVISIYTWSLILSSVTLLIICLSLCLSYTIYELILDIPTFPFMNLLAVVISFGICSDNAMMFCKHWSVGDEDCDEVNENGTTIDNVNQDKTNNSPREQVNLDRLLKKAIVSTFIATMATACSFIISAISRVIAVRCFCIFATLTVLTNYLLIVILLPPALILNERFSEALSRLTEGPRISIVLKATKRIRKNLLAIERIIHSNWIYKFVTKFRFYLIITFITLLICSSILVFYKPTLQPADEEELQLLSTRHAFEQYDKKLKRQFSFERKKLGESPAINSNSDFPDTLPIRIVFGVIPVDNGNHLDPQDRGTLLFDPKFDLADQNVQIWLLEFCHKLRNQRFIHPSTAPDLSNCFIDTFKSWMEARSCRDPILTDLDRSPCCQAYEFPYSRHTFNKCIGEAVNIMRKTPQFHPNINAGIRFFKNSTKVAALIIEYQSNRLYSESFSKMKRFFSDIDDWITWQINNTAPANLKSGWFISNNLELLALQTELEQSTSSSILLEVIFAMLALLAGTRDVILTIAGTLTIGSIIIVTIAILILMKWTLGVAESILISLTIGLSIDFALHYSIAYSENRVLNSSTNIIYKILNDVGGPIALATVTTSLAGFVIVWSDILAYQELGIFLLLIAVVSWTASTFFLLPMLSLVRLLVEHSEFYARVLLERSLKLLLDRL